MDSKEKPVCTVYLARHGITEWNKKRLIQGHTDVALSPDGEKQARELSEKLREISFAGVYSSDLSRARRTAEIIAERHGLPVATTPKLRERFWGMFEGQHFDDVRKRYGAKYDDYIESRADQVDVKHPELGEVETYFEANQRAIAALREIAPSYFGKNLLVVCHGGLIKAILIYMQLESYPNPDVSNTGYVVLKTDGQAFSFKEAIGVKNHSLDFRN